MGRDLSPGIPRTRTRIRHLRLCLAAALLIANGCAEDELQQTRPAPIPPPVGLAAVTDLTALAELRPPGYRTEQTSSYDRTGGNADLGVGPDTADLLALLGIPPVEIDNSYLYRDGDRYVIFDSVGPGVVYRIWMTGLDALFRGGLAGDIAFELDDEPMPRLMLPREDLFSSARPPFVAPLAGNLDVSSGGFYSVVPIPFARRLRISTSTAPNWVHVSATRLPADAEVTSFDPTADTTLIASQLAAVGDDPKGIVPTISVDREIVLPPGATQLLWEHVGAGTIVQLALNGDRDGIPLGLRLQAYWDDASEPQVDAPADDFFGASLGPGAGSLAFGQSGDRYFCYFPMPFQHSARIVVRNEGDVEISGWNLEIGAVDRHIATRPAYFHAAAHAQRVAAGTDDYILLATNGRGHIVGVVLTAGCAEQGRCQLPQLPGLDGSHLEGDEHVSIDGSRYPQVHGTGLEDFFNGGFYFIRGPFKLPTHGNPTQVATMSPRRPGLNLRSAYRLLVADAIPFYEHIRLAIEHGPTNDVPADMSSVVFYYAVANAALVESDAIVTGSAASEAAHAFSAEQRIDRSLRSAFRGDTSDELIDATGVEATRTTFRVRLDRDNQGIRLRRLADIGAGRQAAEIYVDGQLIGTWYSADINPVLRWAELDFEIPAAFTHDRSAVDIEIDARQSPTPWTAYGYTMFSYIDRQ